MLPSGHTSRRATLDDVDAIFDVTAAHNVPVCGDPNSVVEDVADELVEPGFDLDTDGWLVHDADGRAVAWGWAFRKEDSANVDIAVLARPGSDAAAAWLWEAVQGRAVEIAGELGHRLAIVDSAVFRQDERLRSLCEAHGYAPATTFFRLRIDHDGDVPFPEPPVPLELRTADDPDVRRDAHTVREESFSGHFGVVPTSFDSWVRAREASSAHDWRIVHVAYVDGEPAATLVRTNGFVPDDNCGYVLTLATRPAYQGRGLGRYLLRYTFAADAALGRAGTLLHVDTDPKRPALGLYLATGMRPIQTIDVWRRTFETGV
jgi:ribosomal protein S18 acetylase RimI-like enzyme